MKRKCSFQA